MLSDHVRAIIAQQRAIEDDNRPQISNATVLGDLVVLAISATVLVYLLISTALGMLQ